ncbi:FKBP-type peptidyl-prolyl cis-trans isomerase [Membranicola marinus]|uniref:Peptidyl-prolyl cis-trans isomerase n=1 Tax=Membranihabitans marinus TaxID=1227546 RepID=A0A953I0D8_9BACT|nr:FKBP-type peptidyl-prolyl cis-trans isomerase [Membranihabitans marinus]MBY5960076.1 FKBP-type peptidyl-prolyl cis-trans isomerase [Membranihabitans marinus]
MKNWIIILALGAMVLLFSCEEKQQQQNVDWVSVDDKIITDYLDDNNIEAKKHVSGLYYRITQEGNGQHPNGTSIVNVNYKGYFLDGEVFDHQTSIEFPLTNVIQGWQIGIPLVSKGGSIQLFIPSYLAYGRQGNRGIPPNTVLLFDVDLINF